MNTHSTVHTDKGAEGGGARGSASTSSAVDLQISRCVQHHFFISAREYLFYSSTLSIIEFDYLFVSIYFVSNRCS